MINHGNKVSGVYTVEADEVVEDAGGLGEVNGCAVLLYMLVFGLIVLIFDLDGTPLILLGLVSFIAVFVVFPKLRERSKKQAALKRQTDASSGPAGYVVDIENGTLRHKNYDLAIGDIRQINRTSESHRAGAKGQRYSKKIYMLNLDGEFGRVKFRFNTAEVRDELYSLLVRAVKQQNEAPKNARGRKKKHDPEA